MRNNRIGTNGFLNQRCALAPNFESMLLVRTLKIFLQHRHDSEVSESAAHFRRVAAPQGRADLVTMRSK